MNKSIDALLIAYETQENLGVRSLMAVLEEAGFTSVILPFIPGNYDEIIHIVHELNPALVGFSIIFQYTIQDFNQLGDQLRQAGVEAHFTAGGHFPSIRPEQVMDLIPSLDSIVRFEGEYTLLELIKHITSRKAWSEILGLAYRGNGQVLINPPRPLIADLDKLPRLLRGDPHTLSRNVRTASMLASRGCLYDCVFCSIRQFYQGAPGPLRRTRSPKSVVAEMADLYNQNDVRFFNFQDDDFAAKTRGQRRWIDEFLRELSTTGLVDRIIWKIACRVDDVDRQLMQHCQEHGLVGVYLGVESGNSTGLRTLNKHVSVEQNVAAIQILKDLELSFEIGFMLFDPSSTVDTVAQNIAFLENNMLDGRAPMNFCKMLPYAGTPIEALLKKEGRLRGTISQPDYSFLDPRLEIFSHFVHSTFQKRNFTYSGLVERLCTCLFDAVLVRFLEYEPWVEDYKNELQELTSQVNGIAIETLKASLEFIASRDLLGILDGWGYLKDLTAWERGEEDRLEAELARITDRYSPELSPAVVLERGLSG
jgi:anaerobic magnesium-protoporphyrin IX monomethyl ester cyclase